MQQARIYVPQGDSQIIIRVLTAVSDVVEIRSAQAIPILGSPLDDVWQVDFYCFNPQRRPKDLPSQRFPLCQSEIIQQRVQPNDQIDILTFTYRRSDVPDATHLNYLRTANGEGRVRIFKGQHPLLHPASSDGTVVLVKDGQSLSEIVNLLSLYTPYQPIITIEREIPKIP